MGALIPGIGFILIGLSFIVGSVLVLDHDVKFNRKLTEALYSQLGYKYDEAENAPKTLFDESSWLTDMRKDIGVKRFTFVGEKTVMERLDDLTKAVEENTSSGVK